MAKRRFDQNHNRVDYGELLMEDPSFELEQAVGMTYSLDMEALMGIPLCLGMRGEMTSGQRNHPLYVLEAIRRTGKKLSIFCNAGCIKVPKTESRLFALLEDSIHEVRMPRRTYNFHPKLWMLQYHNTCDGRTMIKVVVLSRNLTFDQSMDMAVEMTGYVGEEVNPKNEPLADLLTFVSQFDRRKHGYNRLRSNLRRVEKFDVLDCFEDYEFHPFGIYGGSENGVKKVMAKERRRTAREMFRNCDALLIISPFLSEEVIGDLLDDHNHNADAGPAQRCLITREASVTKRMFHAFGRRDGDGIWVVDPVFSSNDALGDGDTFGYVNRDVHAKVYYTEKYHEPHKLYIGSLNASSNAFEHNVEFLVELHYKKYHSSYQSVRDDFIPDKESPFVPMTDYREDLIGQEDVTVDFRQEVYGVVGARVFENDGRFAIEVYADKDYEGVTIRPFFVKTQTKPLTKITKFEDVALNSLSNLFVLLKDGAQCLVHLEVEDMPSEEREDAIFNDMIANQPMFLTYMRYLLEEDFYDSVNAEELFINHTVTGETMEGYGFTAEPDIYEKMLRAAADDPKRLESMYDVMERIDDNKIGEEFKPLLELFLKAAGRKGNSRK